MAHVFECAGCGRLADSDRCDAVTCSTACRVRAHRTGKVKLLRTVAAQYHTTVANMLRCCAVLELRPDLEDAMQAGTLTVEQAQREIWPLYKRRIFDAVEATQAKMRHSSASTKS